MECSATLHPKTSKQAQRESPEHATHAIRKDTLPTWNHSRKTRHDLSATPCMGLQINSITNELELCERLRFQAAMCRCEWPIIRRGSGSDSYEMLCRKLRVPRM